MSSDKFDVCKTSNEIDEIDRILSIFLQLATRNFRSEYEEDTIPPPLTPAPNKDPGKKETENQVQNKPMPTIVPSFTIPAHTLQNQQTITTSNQIRPGMPSIPLPLLILNSLQPPQPNQEKKEAVSSSSGNCGEKTLNNGRLLSLIIHWLRAGQNVSRQMLQIVLLVLTRSFQLTLVT